MASIFEEKQKAIWIWPLLIIALTVASYAYFFEQTEGMSLLGFFAVIVGMGLVGLLFFQLKTEVQKTRVALSFGIGFLKKHISLNDIDSVRLVRNKWYYGWGIRYYGKGWMWNIWGLDAVELKLSNKKNLFRIGSQRAEELKSSIELSLPKK